MVKKKTANKCCKKPCCEKTGLLSSLVCWVKAKVGACRTCKCN